jgi:hypothetical protein
MAYCDSPPCRRSTKRGLGIRRILNFGSKRPDSGELPKRHPLAPRNGTRHRAISSQRARHDLTFLALAPVLVALLCTLAPALAPKGQGDAYEIRSLHVKGALSLTERDIERATHFKRGLVVTIDRINRAAASVQKQYSRLGFIHAEVSLDSHLTPPNVATVNRGTADLTLNVEEGPRYHIGIITFSGNYKTNHFVCERAAGIRNFVPYNPEDLSKWVAGLNRSGRFQPVAPGDLEVNIHDDRQFAEIIFHVKEKQ